MATGRIGVTPTLGVRWSKAPAGGTTSLSGLDDNSVSLVYSVGYEQVYRNGVLLSRTNDYTATTGNSITLIDATIAGDIIEVFANELVPLTDAISKGQFTAKGALLSATAASTPGVLPVGTNGQYLSADSTASTGLAWASVSAGSNFTLLNSGGTSLSGSSTSITGITGQDKLLVLIKGASVASGDVFIQVQFNSNTGSVYSNQGLAIQGTGAYDPTNIGVLNGTLTNIRLMSTASNAASAASGYVFITGCNSAGVKVWQGAGGASSFSDQIARSLGGIFDDSSTISSVQISCGSSTFDAGTVFIYGSA